MLLVSRDCTSLSGNYFTEILLFEIFQLRVGAYDSRVAYDVTTSTVLITVLRNDNEPIFLEEPYELVLSESTIIGTSVYRITANDADRVSRLLFLNPCIAGRMF